MKTAGTIAAMCVVLVVVGCSSIPPPSERAISPYSVTKENNQFVSLFVDIFPIQKKDVVTAQVWYQQEHIADGLVLYQTGTTVRIVFRGWFPPEMTGPAIVKLITTNDEMHVFDVGDPVNNTDEIFHGTYYSLK